MVKPSKNMQPEHVDLEQASKRIGKGAAFGEDSFRNYMAMKIATQRQQFGLKLPPPPQQNSAPTQTTSSLPPQTPNRNRPYSNKSMSSSAILKRPTLLERSSLPPASPARSSDRSVRFADEPKKSQTTKMESMIRRLKQRHGKGNRRLERKQARKRKRDERKTDPAPMKESPQEDGLEELDRLFATVGEAEVGNQSDLHESQRKVMKQSPTATIQVDSSSIVGDGLTELDRVFASGSNDTSPFLPCHSNQHGPTETLVSRKNIVTNGKDTAVVLENHESQQNKERILPNEVDGTTIDIESPGLNEEAEVLSAATTPSSRPPSPKTIRRLRPDLFFYGIVVKIAGYTHPDNETIKRLLQKHGGDLETYETERVTHIIAQQLSTAKANLYKKARKPRPVCRPAWIVDSVKEGKLLPQGDYLLIEGREQQQMGIQTMFQKREEKRNHESTKPSNDSPRKPSAIQKNPYAKTKHTGQSPEKFHGNLAVAEETPQVSETRKEYGINRESPKKTDSRLINGKVRTIGTDPNFLDSYFASSRLSFIGSFKQRAASIHHSNGNQAPSNSKRLIFHVDMDCFFASVVLRNYPQYKDKPVVISHHGSRNKDEERGNNASVGHIPKNSYSECATCNYEARKYGIKKGMFLGRARELCSELIILDYDFDGYEEVSQQVSEILDRVATLETHPGVVEAVSCDEFYVELNFDASQDSENLHDQAYEVAESIRNEIFETTRCTASIGVGANKFLAKLGTDKAKPNKSYCVRNYRELMKDLNLRDVHGVGWRTEKKLAEEGLITVQDVWDLGSRGETELIRILGPGTGKKIFNFTEGKDDRTITPVERKTIGAECNYGVRFDGPYGIDHFMEGLAKEVQKRMEGISMKGKKLTLKIKHRKENASKRHKWLGHGSCHNLSKSIGIPGNIATRDSKIFKKVGLSLYKEFAIADIHDIRGMGITISSLEADDESTKQTNPSGMQQWLQRSIEQEVVKESGKNMDDVPTTPNLEKRPGIDANTLTTEKEIGEEASFAVQLPPMSQIHMSQVEALPLDLQQQVRSRMEKDRAARLDEAPFEGHIERVEGEMVEEIYESDQFIGSQSPNQYIKLHSTPQSNLKVGNSEQNDSDVFQNVESPLLIELPPMSQIQMSQVEALPPELREQIYSRMNQTRKEPEIVDMTEEEQPVTRLLAKQPVISEPNHRFRQTDLKRMMKLAAVKSGQEQTNISLTQLDQLPLEIRLQVVNGDNQQVGILSQHENRASKKSIHTTVNQTEDYIPKPSVTTRDPKRAPNTNQEKHSMAMTTTTNGPKEPQREFQIIDRVDVWKEDLLPLKEFLTDNCPLLYPQSIQMVLDFLTIVLNEGRLPAMVSMIRCIRNRSDGWSQIQIVERIVTTLNQLHKELYGASLDVAWLMGKDK